MNSQHALTVYNAAAGAGKTYTLVKEYLTTLLSGEYKEVYKNILAITFTNKAVAEMKTRVLENLVAISDSQTPPKYKDLLSDLSIDTGIPEQELKSKANRIIKSILHNYASFDIVTIDTFTHRVIRTFAHDLGIPMNFEIEMDTDSLIKEAVDAVIAKIGVDKELTKIIVDFAYTKLEEDKSWDITTELNKVAHLIYSENDREYLNQLSNKTKKDFEELKNGLYKNVKEYRNIIVSDSKRILQLIAENEIDNKDFTRGSIPNHFQKLAQGEIKIDYTSAWKQNIQTTSFYSAKLNSFKKEAIDSIRPLIEEAFLRTKKTVTQIKFFKNIIKNLTPLTVLNTINKELQEIKSERKILLISEFNSIISSAIQDQPAPFIYERLGERYRDYFIDEFQDTSELQWNNLIPLIDNAVSAETLAGKKGHVTIVGDAKQAIYRWRGGKAEQFIDLSLEHNPFSVKEKKVFNLPKNYRSHQEIIKFNNSFFTFLANDFSVDVHKDLYKEGNQQQINTKKEGYVNLSFINAKNVDEENELYPQRVYEIIQELLSKGYSLSDICVLTRKQKEGVAIADYLTEKELSIISSETLLLSNSPDVLLIIDLLTWYIQPDHLIAKTNILYFLAERFDILEKHTFIKNTVFGDRDLFVKEIENYGVSFDFNQLATRPFYESVEYIVNCFNLADYAPAYLQFFLDVIFSYSQKNSDGIMGFLSYWNQKKDKLSIVAPRGESAIQIMTIHKSKGLEFPCVIYPYANVDIYRELEPKTWLGVNGDEFHGFNEVLIDYSKEISDYGAIAKKNVSERQAQLELDMFNLLYVALTRAEQQLYIISKLELNAKGGCNLNKFSGKLINYLKHLNLWNEELLEYEFGDHLMINRTLKDSGDLINNIKISHFSNSNKKYKINILTNSGLLWDTSQEAAIAKGNLIHELMASVYTYKDVDVVVEEANMKGLITSMEKVQLQMELNKLIEHPKLKSYFSEENTIFNERDIISNGRLYRPDRICIDKNGKTTIIDYKTGRYSSSHSEQLYEYGEVLRELGYNVGYKILVYLNENIDLKFV